MSDLLRIERKLWNQGVKRVAGVDEVGMGPLAGPVVAAAVMFPAGVRVKGVRDSKTLTSEQREVLSDDIQRRAIAFGIGLAEVGEINALNIYHAGLLAMSRAVCRLSSLPQ